MKISKSRLKRVIKEEVEYVLAEGKMKRLQAFLKTKAAFWVGETGLTDDEVDRDPAAAWLDILTMVTTNWGKHGSKVYGCITAPEDINCRIIAAAQNKLNGILNLANDSEDYKIWVPSNYRKVKSTFHFIPVDASPAAIKLTHGWKAFAEKPEKLPKLPPSKDNPDL